MNVWGCSMMLWKPGANALMTSWLTFFKVTKPYLMVNSSNIWPKTNEWDEGSPLTKEGLMILTENKYKALVRLGEWQAPKEDQKEVLAMRVQMDDLKKKKKSCSRRLNRRRKCQVISKKWNEWRINNTTGAQSTPYGHYINLENASWQSLRRNQIRVIKAQVKITLSHSGLRWWLDCWIWHV